MNGRELALELSTLHWKLGLCPGIQKHFVLGVKSLSLILLQNPPFLRFDERGAKFFALKSRINHIYFSRGCFDEYFPCSVLTREVLQQNQG